jgi:RHS repeat-associated protein
MKTISQLYFFTILMLCVYFPVLSASQSQLVSTESDPDAFIQNSVNVLNGDYCESATDLVIAGPDLLLLQRFYNSKDYSTGNQAGGWRMLPQRFLVKGKDSSGKWIRAFAGERSGGILPYSGWRDTNGVSQGPLKIDVLNHAPGMVNTYAKEINGQTNHQNNLLHCNGNTCELVLGDGTKRIYQKVQSLPCRVLGEELTPLIASQVIEPEYFLLIQEILPSSNQMFFSYDTEGHLVSVEMKNKTQNKTFSCMHFSYDFCDVGCQVHIETSDAKTLTYHFIEENGSYQLAKVEGSHLLPVSYEYQGALIKKTLPERRFVEIDYHEGTVHEGKVKSLKGPHPTSGIAETFHSFSYGTDYTDVFDALGVKTRYHRDKRSQLTAIERYDDQNTLYRTEKKFWGRTKADAGLLLAKTIADGNGRIHSYRSFQYDSGGNVLKERLYGNLTGKQEASLQVSADGTLLNADEEECHIKTFGYSADGFNLLTSMGDCKGNQTLYTYQAGTNLLVKKLISAKTSDKTIIKRRTFHTYNDDAVCIKTIEDDGSQEEENGLEDVKERHIKEFKPKEALPGVGLPEVIEEKGLDLNGMQEILIKKLVNSYDEQGYLLSCSTYDANNQYACMEKRTYNSIGQVIARTDAAGRKSSFTYDSLGNQISVFIPHEDKYVTTLYDLHNQPIKITETVAGKEFIVRNSYDSLGRKISSTDRFGNSTCYEYDAFHRLTKVIHPEVLDENNNVIAPTFTYGYDIFGNVTSILDAKDFTTFKYYNLRGDPTKIDYPDGTFEVFKYDTEGSLHRSLTRDQIVTVYEYDYLGRSVYEESSTAKVEGSTSFVISRSHQYNGFRCTYDKEDDYVKRYSYDFAGRISSLMEGGKNEKDPESRLTEIFYDPLGRIHQKKVWFDIGPEDYALECFEYDLLGNTLEKRIEDSKGDILLRKGFSYNLRGQCIEEYCFEKGKRVSLLQTSYDARGEPIEYSDASGFPTKVVIETVQNGLGQKVLKKTIINALMMQTQIEFDALGRVSSIVKRDLFGVLLSSQKILYDSLGNKACEIHDQVVDDEIVGSKRLQWVHGPMGRLEEEIEAAGSPLEKKICYSYNSSGKISSKVMQGASSPIKYTYNKDGNLHKIESQSPKKELQISNSYSYDRKGNIISAHALQGKSVERSYNVFNQVTKETVKDGEGTYSLEYAYDRKGRLKEVTLPDSTNLVYTYDAVFGRKVERSSGGDPFYTHTYDKYNEQGHLLKETLIGEVGSLKHAYDPNGRKIATKGHVFSEEYSRDGMGRVWQIKNDNQKNYYQYNDLSQLISETNPKKKYTYDSLDNCIQKNGEELIYNALNQLTLHSKTEFSYDPHGNLLRKVLDGEETHFENNILSQLISIEKADQTKTTFSYDPFGRLLVKKHLNVKGKYKKTLSTTRYFYIGHQEIGTFLENGRFETLKVPGIQGNELSLTSIAIEVQCDRYAPIHDIAGNVVRLVDHRSTATVESYRYSAFGEETIYNSHGKVEKYSVVGNPWRFAEKRVDEDTGLILFALRFYDPAAGRWISQDPAGFVDGPNLYAYIHNNPLSNLDRFGLATEAISPNTFMEYFFGEFESHCYCERHRTCKRGGDIGKTTGSQLPKILYDDEFEEMCSNYAFEGDLWKTVDLNEVYRPYHERSKVYDLSDQGLPELPDMEIEFINGIDNSYADAKKNAMYISRLAGGCNVHAVYNATHGKVKDLNECQMGLNYIATSPVRQLHQMWNSFFEKRSAKAKLLIICHSQGAIHVRNALLDYPPELRERIIVIAIAPGGYIYPESCAQVVHYRGKAYRDPIPRYDTEGAERAKDTIIELDSHPKAPLHDHKFESPTYEHELFEKIRIYIKTQGGNI